MATPSRGRIVWVEITDPQDQNPKCRPSVIVTPTEDIAAGTPVLVVAVSTRIEAASPEECVELPWQRNRHPRTGLTEHCVAVCTWLRRIQLAEVQEYGGTVPGKQLLEILGKVGHLPP